MKFLKNYHIQHWWTLAKQFYFAGFLVTLVLKAMNQRMRWPKWHFILLYLQWNILPVICIMMWHLFVINSGKLTGINVQATNSILLNLTSDTTLSSWSRRDAVVLRRLRIGHTRLSHSYLLSRDQPLCSSCCALCALTVIHLLLEYPLYINVRGKHFSVLSSEELFYSMQILLLPSMRSFQTPALHFLCMPSSLYCFSMFPCTVVDAVLLCCCFFAEQFLCLISSTSTWWNRCVFFHCVWYWCALKHCLCLSSSSCKSRRHYWLCGICSVFSILYGAAGSYWWRALFVAYFCL